MTGVEIVWLVGALVAVFGFLFVVRRASERSQLKGGPADDVRRRLRDARKDEDEEDREKDEEEEERAVRAGSEERGDQAGRPFAAPPCP